VRRDRGGERIDGEDGGREVQGEDGRGGKKVK